jgi:hypothetical protein
MQRRSDFDKEYFFKIWNLRKRYLLIISMFASEIYSMFITVLKRHLQNRKSQCLANPNVQPDFYLREIWLDFEQNVCKQIVYCCLNIPWI